MVHAVYGFSDVLLTHSAWGSHFVAWCQFKLVTTTHDTCCANVCGMRYEPWSTSTESKCPLIRAQIASFVNLCKRLNPLDHYIHLLSPVSKNDISKYLHWKAAFPRGCGQSMVDLSSWKRSTILASHVTLFFLRPWSLNTFSSLHVFATHGCIMLYLLIRSARWGWVWSRSSSTPLVEIPLGMSCIFARGPGHLRLHTSLSQSWNAFLWRWCLESSRSFAKIGTAKVSFFNTGQLWRLLWLSLWVRNWSGPPRCEWQSFHRGRPQESPGANGVDWCREERDSIRYESIFECFGAYEDPGTLGCKWRIDCWLWQLAVKILPTNWRALKSFQ